MLRVVSSSILWSHEPCKCNVMRIFPKVCLCNERLILDRFKNNLEFQSRGCMSMSVSLSRTFLEDLYSKTYPSWVIVEWITCMRIYIRNKCICPARIFRNQARCHWLSTTFPTKNFNLSRFFSSAYDENKIFSLYNCILISHLHFKIMGLSQFFWM